ncbi:amino acid ABC transporter substrate-binding protein [Pseudomonas sp. HMWF032]|uniref:substrate-binding periplasmic protein n=1 Tax=Pseudomonas sp. HMWF032 TaxID=2056866 RepID=UPI000D355318|nr:ABC transporter substrate-binding protein [Pseudomonas sp. HMWF032]PTS83854.1 amino acid ABC transporter substrate-binding protein [Pseudomonas sp. HMWF032]PTT80448.1 amino acid ABC transporter substrate-binding protein [Pseudomonas sp. HMWF010]
MKWIGVLGLLLCSLTVSAHNLRIGFGTHKPPYIFEDEDRGLEHDIVMSAARHGGLQPTAYYAPLERLNMMLRKGQLDAIAATNELNGGDIVYSHSYIRYHNVAVALRSRNLEIQQISDLARYSVNAFQRARFLLGAEFQRMAQANPRYREEAFQIARNRMLYSGRVDVVVTDMRILRYFNREVYTQVDVTQPLTLFPIFAANDYKLGCREWALCERFNLGLAELRKTGEYAQIEGRYAIY